MTARRPARVLEADAGVEQQQGRSFYGLRRQATDLAPEFEQDARVLNRLTGHLDSAPASGCTRTRRTSGYEPGPR
ncbi:MAG TPA: hypothetical protein VNP72_02250 [Longimicrobium sp.]|nr:hypothetical protein [Longimicrobium sp.]